MAAREAHDQGQWAQAESLYAALRTIDRIHAALESRCNAVRAFGFALTCPRPGEAPARLCEAAATLHESWPAVVMSEMTRSEIIERVVMFGGEDGSGKLGDTWEYDGTTWTLVLKGENGFSGASDLSMDATNPRILYAAFWDHQRTPWYVRSGGAGSAWGAPPRWRADLRQHPDRAGKHHKARCWRRYDHGRHYRRQWLDASE